MIGGTELKVGIGDMKFSRGEGRIITYALGSCIGITFYDPVTRLGALGTDSSTSTFTSCEKAFI